ncbi:MAG TPA: YbhB/YbcL family Raf kinase inhibitor-like protein [Candidatus Limnocylindrales bacterium]|nr:YbhB/YbcL family Raf kinase inhibitor-like protein [Candidatus Limnocylindrales bacterium]
MPDDFRLTSTAFADGEAIPAKYTCDGADVSPALSWQGAPEGTAALALIVDDADAPKGTFAHWVVYDMTGTSTGALPEAISESPEAPPQGRNDFRRVGWGGPCPPSGTHRYVLHLYALSEVLGLNGAPTADELRQAMAGRVIAEATLTGTYRRSG